MTPTRKRRLIAVALILLAVGVATALTVIALQPEHDLSVLAERSAGRQCAGRCDFPSRRRRAGAFAAARSGSSLKVDFTVTDRFHDMPVEYTGILPDLFREGQSIVATGSMDDAISSRAKCWPSTTKPTCRRKSPTRSPRRRSRVCAMRLRRHNSRPDFTASHARSVRRTWSSSPCRRLNPGIPARHCHPRLA